MHRGMIFRNGQRIRRRPGSNLYRLRYPEEKEDVTGYIYESWHIRYVGAEAAAEIHEQGITLEEYLGVLD